MTAVDWTVLTEDGIEEVASNAARSVSRKLGDKRTAYLAEYDDLLQEARIILATRLAKVARACLDSNDRLSLLELKLTDDLRDLVKAPRIETISADEMDCE